MDSRRRNIKSANETSNDGEQKQHETHDRKKPTQGTRLGDEYVIVCLILVGAALAGIAHYAMERYLPLPEDRQLHRMDFDYRKAREHLVSLTDFGPRVVGSVENEVLAPKYIMDQLEKMQANDLNKELFEMQFEVFRSDGGSFALEFLHEYVSVYRNIASVVLRILPKKVTPASALLINCHYDTVADSPGAGDDTASCALMLEMARAAVSSDQPLQNALVFLWNGAEENMLQASHAFVTQHRWFAGPPRIAAFVNLDAAGSSGREIAFQIGPENPWLIEAYAKTVQYAWASILAQEFFECEIVPGVTDYRQFRDTGRLPGVDVAFIQNGYVYHTQFDTADRIADASLHRAGTNMLALVREVANSSLLANPGAQRHGKVVFYDILGMFMVVYPHSVGTIINFLVCFLLLAVSIRPKLFRHTNQGTYGSLLVKMFGVILMKIALTFAVNAVIGLALSRLGRHSMSWYTYLWPTFVYLIPIGLVQFFVTGVTRKRLFPNETRAQLEEVHFDAFQMLVVLFTLIFTAFNLGGAYFPMLFALNSFIVRNLIYDRIIRPRRSAANQVHSIAAQAGVEASSTFEVFIVNLASYALVLAQSAYLCRTFASLLVPMLSRAGTEMNCEVFYGVLLSFMAVWPMLCQSSILYRIRLDRAIVVCCTIFSALFVILCVTDLGFPYSVSTHTKDVFPKRISLSHTTRVLIHDDKVVENKTYLWLAPLDPLEMELFRGYLQKVNVNVDDSVRHRCDSQFWPYCGVPTIYPAALIIRPQWMVNIPQSYYPHRTVPELKQVDSAWIQSIESTGFSTTARTIRLTFELYNTPSHSTLYFANRLGSTLAKLTLWTGGNQENPDTYDYPLPAYSIATLDEKTGETYERKHYFVYNSHGTAPSGPLRFAVDFRVQSNLRGKVPLAEIAVAAMYITGPDIATPFQKQVRDSLPEWVSGLAWGTHYEARTLHAILN